jgi:hypothetical protein
VTVGNLLYTMQRRWAVMAAGLLITLVTCLVAWRTPGVYWASTKVLFLVPTSTEQPNQLAPANSATLALAGLIETEINGGIPLRRATSPDVTLVDEGIYDGWTVFMPDIGGQWAHNFSEPSLIVRASGPTPEVVRSRMENLIAEIQRLVEQREVSAQVAAVARVEFTMSPPTVTVQYSSGHSSRAILVIVPLGLLVSLALGVVVDRVAGSRRRGGSRSHGSDSDARVRDAARGDQDGAGRQGAGAPSLVAAGRGRDRAAPGDA